MGIQGSVNKNLIHFLLDYVRQIAVGAILMLGWAAISAIICSLIMGICMLLSALFSLYLISTKKRANCVLLPVVKDAFTHAFTSKNKTQKRRTN